MAGAGDGPLSAAIKWGESTVHLKDFTSKCEAPAVVKVTKGQYRNIGFAKNVQSELYLHSIKTSKKVLAEGVKIKEGKKRIETSEQKFSLPLSYQGWFELLSEDGKAIKAIQSVPELLRLFPQSCLVRENIKAFIAKDNGELSETKTRVVNTGEQLTLVGDLNAPLSNSKGGVTNKRLLRCFDTKGESIYLSLDQKGGLFSPIAGQGNISGVHNIKGLLEKFRMPIMVRLVHGIIPSRLDKNSFTGVFRLLSLYSDETAFVCPLKKDAKMVPISTREALKLVVGANFEELVEHEDCSYYHMRCSRMIASYMNSIHVLVSLPDIQALVKPQKDDQQPVPAQSEPPRNNAPVSPEVNDIMDEIDDIYQYVRDGGNPPTPRQKSTSSSGNASPPGKQTPAPLILSSTPFETKHQMDDNYWEEPIYEEISKFRRKSAGKDQPNVIVGTTVSVDTGAKGYNTETMESGSSGESRHTTDKRIVTGAPPGQVENLRQAYKKPAESTHLAAKKSPQEVISDSKPNGIPPIPPKRFDVEPEAPKPVEINVTSSLKRNSYTAPVTSPSTVSNDSKLSPGNNKNNNITTVNSPSALNANHLVYRRPPSTNNSVAVNRISVGASPAVSPSAAAPTYVAVARVGVAVGPSTLSQTGASDEGSQQRFDKVGGRVESAKRKLQNMYL